MASITRATMANWVILNSDAFFRPMYEYFRRKLLEREFAMADETPLQVLHEPGRRAQSKSYMWLFRSGEDGGVPIILYKYSETRAGDNAVEFLQGFKGYLMCDGYSGYNKVPDAKRTACWAHIRRHLWMQSRKGKTWITASLLCRVSCISTVSSVWKKRSRQKVQPSILSKKHALKKKCLSLRAFCRGLTCRNLPGDPGWIRQSPISKTAAPIL